MKTNFKIKTLGYLFLIISGTTAVVQNKNLSTNFVGWAIGFIATILLYNEIMSYISKIEKIKFTEGIEKGFVQGNIEAILLVNSLEELEKIDKKRKDGACIILCKDRNSLSFNHVIKNRWGSKGKIIG